MALNPDKFTRIAESLRQYRRAELIDFNEVGGDPIDLLYVDPLESDAVLKTVLMNNTTFLVGRKGTGKSTIFAKAQSELRKRSDTLSIYIDVKSLHELLRNSDVVIQTVGEISDSVLQEHSLRKNFLSAVIADLIKELKSAYEKGSLIDRWTSPRKTYKVVIAELEQMAVEVKDSKLSQEEVPILSMISKKTKIGSKVNKTAGISGKVDSKISISPEIKGGVSAESFEQTISDNEVYREYADAVLRSFPFANLLEKIKDLLDGVKLKRLFVFFDDFSELSWVDQRLFVDVILSPLNNASNESIKLKIAGYPGRIYYGKIDPGKVDTIGLDFYQLYKSNDIQASESAGTSYLERILLSRFNKFEENIGDYFDPSLPLPDYYRLLFEVTLNVPRLIGNILHNCYLDRVSKNQLITATSIRLAAQKYYENVIIKYFNNLDRFAIEPFEQKLDRHNQKQLLQYIIEEAKNVKKRITAGEIGGKFFEGVTNPPVSHFTVNPSMEQLLTSLELNFLVTKYHEMRDKDGKDISVYALFYGVCESERLPWGYPKGRRDDRSYFVQRCFNFNQVIQQFLTKNQTIRCENCSTCFSMEKRDYFEFYKWKCPECHTGHCEVKSLEKDFKSEVDALNEDSMLPPVELEILQSLHEESVPLKAKQIGALIDITYQLVGRRTEKLREAGLVNKFESPDGKRSSITAKAINLYFGE